jgi:hypothetical protein
MAHEARHGSGDNGDGAQARLQCTPGPSDPGTPRHQIQHTIDLPHQELGLKRALEPP